jgi:multidrug efflux system membrane fusion protein
MRQQAVSVRKVALGPGDATNVVITNGLKPGEMVVIDGADKLKDGAKVLLRQQSRPQPPRPQRRHSTGTGTATRTRPALTAPNPPLSRAAG